MRLSRSAPPPTPQPGPSPRRPRNGRSDRWWVAYGDPQLDKLIDEALRGAPDLAKAQARVRQAPRLCRANSGLYAWGRMWTPVAPFGVFEVKQSYNNGVPKAAVPHGWNDTGQVGLSLDWQLDFFGKNRALLAAATSEAQAARADEAQARLSLSTSVAATYADLAQLYADRHAAEDAAARARRQRRAHLAARCAGQGLETQAALERAHSGRAAPPSRKPSWPPVDEAIGLTRNSIAALIGPGARSRPGDHAEPAPGAIRAFGLPAELQANLLGRRPDVVAARLTAEAAAKRIKVAKADFYPNVNLTGLIGVQSLGLNMLTKAGSGMGSIGPAVTLPIFRIRTAAGQPTAAPAPVRRGRRQLRPDSHPRAAGGRRQRSQRPRTRRTPGQEPRSARGGEGRL